MKYRKRPVVIEAIQYDGTPAGANAVFDTFDIPGATFVPYADFATGYIRIPTLEGTMVAGAGDWIIRGVRGEFYPCKPDIFEATYEAAGDAPHAPPPHAEDAPGAAIPRAPAR